MPGPNKVHATIMACASNDPEPIRSCRRMRWSTLPELQLVDQSSPLPLQAREQRAEWRKAFRGLQELTPGAPPAARPIPRPRFPSPAARRAARVQGQGPAGMQPACVSITGSLAAAASMLFKSDQLTSR